MNVNEIMTKVKAGEISLDFCGHYKSDFTLRRYDRIFEGSVGKYDGKWNLKDNSTIEQQNETMRNFYQRLLDFEVCEGESLATLDYEQCFYCGQMLYWVYDNDKLSLRYFYDKEDEKFKNHDLNYRCEYENKKIFSGKIEVNDKLLIFSDYFESIDYPIDGINYNPCYLNGIDNIIKYKMNKNIIYCHLALDNSVGVYLSKNKDSIIIGPGKHPIEDSEESISMSDEEYLKALEVPVFEGYEFIKKIDMCGRSFEVANLSTLKKEKISKDIICLDVKHGIWEFNHFYDENGDGNNRYSIINLV